MLTEGIKNYVHLQTKAPTHVQTFVKMSLNYFNRE